MRKVLKRLPLLVVFLLAIILATAGQAAAAGGPIVLSGDDADDGGNHCRLSACGQLYGKALNFVVTNSNSGGTGIIAIGGSFTGGAITALKDWNKTIHGGPNVSITHVSSTTDIAGIDFSNYAAIYIPSNDNNTSRGITSSQLTALNARQADIVDFVNNLGGGLLALTEAGDSHQYGWLPLSLNVGNTSHSSNQVIRPTAEMDAITPGLTASQLSHCCYHTVFTGPDGFSGLKVLAYHDHNGNGQFDGKATDHVIILGGVQVTIQGNIELDPATATLTTGDQHTVTATAEDGDPLAPVQGALIDFDVSGANAGASGTCNPANCETDSNGMVSFTYTGNNEGTDNIAASFVDGNGTTQTSNTVNAIWEAPVNLPPVANAGPDQTVEATGAITAVTLDGTLSSDPDSDPLTYLWTGTFGSATGVSPTINLPLGTHTISLVVNDGTVDSAVDTVSITVRDTTKPVITAPANVTACNNPGQASAVVTFASATATDNSGSATVTQTIGLPSGSAFPVGTTTVTWTATDASGNTATASITVTVNDCEKPVITTQNLTVEATGTTTPVNIAAVTSATDNVGVTSGPTASNNGPFPIGSTTVTWTASDAAGNVGTATQVVTVVDTTPPAITAPADVTACNDPDQASAVVSFASATATDNSGSATVTQTSGPASGSAFPVGTTTVTWTATDASGNTASASITVTVNDCEPPVINTSDITVEATGPTTPVDVAAVTSATDNVGVTSGPTASNNGPFPIGSTTVTWTAEDAAGNVGTATQVVTVVDTTPPEITAPADVTTCNDPGQASAVVSFASATATDNSGSATVTQTSGPASGSAFPIGTTTVTWTATDASGNTASASITVTVNDCEPPVIDTSDITVEATGTTTPVDIAAVTSAADNVGVTSGPTASNNGPFPIGSTTVTWTATDAAGNVGTATQVVTVVDTTPPEIDNACLTDTLWPPNHKLVLVSTGSFSDIVDPDPSISISVTSNQPINGTGDGNTDSDWEAVDNGDGTYSVSLRAERAGNIGQRDYTITLTATDAAGNSSEAECAASVPHDQGNNNSPGSKKKK